MFSGKHLASSNYFEGIKSRWEIKLLGNILVFVSAEIIQELSKEIHKIENDVVV